MNKKSKIMSILLAFSSLICTNVFAAPEMQSFVLHKGFGAAGDFVFTTVAGSTSECQVKGADGGLTIYLCLNPPGNDCSAVDNGVAIPPNGDFTLVAGSTYHLIGTGAVRAVSNGYNTNYGSYPNRVQISRIFCSNVSTPAIVSSSGMYNASCDASGCTRTSGPITVTFP